MSSLLLVFGPCANHDIVCAVQVGRYDYGHRMDHHTSHHLKTSHLDIILTSAALLQTQTQEEAIFPVTYPIYRN